MLTDTMGGVSGAVSEAAANLTMFSKECTQDV